MAKRYVDKRGHRVSTRIIAYTSSFAVAIAPSLPAFAQVVASGDTATTITPVAPGTTNITTGTISAAGIAYNEFSQFNIPQDQTVNLYQPDSTKALVNVVDNIHGLPSRIDGTLNALKGTPGSASSVGSNVFIVDANGFVVGSSGIINAGKLTLSTATQAFGQALIDEASSGGDSVAEQLFSGTEELSDGSIETYGVINASRLDLRAGARLVLGGQIDVIDSPSGGSGVVSVVNTDDITEARGVSTEGGVLRFTAGTSADVSGDITARRNGAGGVVTGSTEGDMSLSGTVDVSGSNDADAAGSVLLFAEGSAFMEAGLRIDASSVAGNGGFIFIEANYEDPTFDPTTSTVTLATPSIRAQGDLLTSGGTAAKAGVTWLSGETVEVAGDLTTGGGNLFMQGDEGVVVRSNVTIDSRNVSATGAAGDVIVSAPAIVLEDSSSILATGDSSGNKGGLVALIARDITEGSRWNINVENNKALIRLENATVSAGAVVLNAFAQTGNVLGELDGAVSEAEYDAFEEQQASYEDQIIEFLDTVEDTVVGVLENGLATLQGLIPVQVQVMSADARIVVNDSEITADGNWKGKSLTVDSAFDGDAEVRGLFSAAGLLEGGLALLGDTAPGILVTLPTIFDPSRDAIFIQAHSQTDVTIAPKAFGLGIGVSVTNTDSRVTIADSDLTSRGLGPNAARDIAVRSTATENLNVAIAASPIAGVSIGLVVAVHALRNQLVIDGGNITSARALEAGAFSSRAHSLSAAANGGKDGKGAVALNIEVGNAITEAALGGTIRTQGDLNLAAETLYFGKDHATSATLGLADPLKTAINKAGPVAAVKGKVDEVTKKIKERISGKKKDDAPSKPGFAFGLAFDLQLDRDDTYASLGGRYRDLSNGNALVSLGATSVQTARLGAVNVTSTLRFASTAEGGSELSRSVDASMGFLDRVAEAELKRLNDARALLGQEPITKEELFGQFGNAVFLNGSVMLMGGETVAEIGSNAEITVATALNVNATTLYPEFDRFTDVRDEFIEFAEDVAEFQLIEGEIGEDATVNPPPALPDIVALADLGNYLTTYTGAYADQNQLDDPPAGQPENKSQNLAVAVSVNVFNTDNVTRAAIRDGARIDLSDAAGDLAGDVSVTAEQRGLFTHMQNFPTDLRTITDPIGSDDNVTNRVGGAVTLARTVSRVEALVEGGAEITADTLDIDAHNRAIVFNLVYAGGAAANVAINAAIAAQAVENVTIARLSDRAKITTGDLTITSLDDSFIMGLAGAFAGSDGAVSVGASGVVNFAKRQVYAGIGPAERDAALGGTAGEVRISARTLTIRADNDAITVATSVAGSRVSGKPVDDSPTPPADEENEEDMIIPSWLFAEDENEALSAQNQVDAAPAGKDDQQSKTGWSVAGAATVNLMLQNETVSEIATNAQINVSGNLGMTATNSSFGIAGAGAVSVGLGSTQKNNALAGAFAVTVDERDVLTLVRGASISAMSAALRADDDSVVVGVAVGGAGSSNGKVTLAGSVAVNVLTGETRTDVSNTTLSTTNDLELYATDESLTVGVGGAVSINMTQGEGAGVGIGIAVNVVDRGASTRVSGATLLDARHLTVGALSSAQIYGFGISAGAGKTGIAGSIAVNTITGGAKALIGTDGGPRVTVKAESLTVQAEEDNQIWSLAGALTFGRNTAVGGALTANVIVVSTGAEVVDTDVTGRHPAAGAPPGAEPPALASISVTADSTSLIGTIAVAGAVSAEGTGVGVGISGNNITAGIAASLAGSSVTDAGLVTIRATNDRTIRSLGGGVAGSGRGAGGFAATLNLLIANDTIVNLDGADITTTTGDITATAEATGVIETIAAAVSASQNTSIGGAATVNVSTGLTRVSANGAVLDAGGALVLSATDSLTIRSLAGGVAVSIGGSGVGAALATNVIANNTLVEANNADLSSKDGGLSLLATNDALIESLAVGLAVSGGPTAVSGSIAIGYIGNETRVNAAGTSLVAGTEPVTASGGQPAVPADRRGITLAADKSSTIRILSGAAAGGSNTAVGAAIAIAVIQDTVTADLVANDRIFGGTLNLTATNDATIDAIAVAGGASGTNAIAGSFVYTQIGKPPAAWPSIPTSSTPAASEPGADETDDPIGDGMATVEDERDAALAALGTRGGYGTALDLARTNDITRARLALSASEIDLAGIEITANETSAIQSFAGTLAASGNVGVGVGIGVNLLFGRTEAELVIPEGVTARTNRADVNVAATQTGTISTLGVALGGAGTVGGAGSILVNVFERTLLARAVGADTNAVGGVVGANLLTDGGDVTVGVTQTGTIEALAGVVAVGGVAGVGGAFGVSVLSDTAEAAVEDVLINTALAVPTDAARPLVGAGQVNVLATADIELDSIVAAAAGGGKGAFGGSVAINIAEGSVTAAVRRSTVYTDGLRVDAFVDNTLSANAGALAIGGFAAGGMGVTTNVSRMTVLADVDGSTVRAQGNVIVEADAQTAMSGVAVGGAATVGVAVVGTGVGNSARNTVSALIRNTGAETAFGGSDIVTRGSAIVRASGRNTITLSGSEDDLDQGSSSGPALNLNFSVGSAGIGVAVSVNETANIVTTGIEDQSRLAALGETALTDARLETFRGVGFDAFADTTIDVVTVNAAAGAVAAVSGLLTFNIVSDEARVRVGGDSSSEAAQVNTAVSDTISTADMARLGGSVVANAAQDTILRADVRNDIEAYTVGVAVGGGVSVGAASGNNLIDSTAEVALGFANVAARRDVRANAGVDTTLESWVLGIGGGWVGVAGSVDLNIIKTTARVAALGSQLDAGRNLSFGTNATNDIFNVAAGAAVGTVGVAGGFVVNVLDSTSEIVIASKEDPTPPAGGVPVVLSLVAADQNVTLQADTTNTTEAYAASAAGGLVGVALAANVNLVKSTTRVDVGSRSTLRAGTTRNAGVPLGSLSLQSNEYTTINGLAGSVGAGLVGAGASLDYVNFAANTSVLVGADARLLATGSITASALARRDVASTVGVAAIGVGGLSAALSVIEMGGLSTDGKSDRDTNLARVQSSLNQDQDTGSASDEGRASDIAAYAGGDDVRSRLVTARQGVSVTGAPSIDDVGVSIGDRATLEAYGNVTLSSLAELKVVQNVGSIAGGLVGISAAVGVVTVETDSAVLLGDNVSIRSDAATGLSARVTGLNGAPAVNSRVASLAGSLGFSASAGVSSVSANSASRIVAGSGTVFAGVLGQRSQSVTLLAERTDAVQAEVYNLSASVVGGVGLALARVQNDGQTVVSIGGATGSRIDATSVSLTARDASLVKATSAGASGGLLFGGNGAEALVTNRGEQRITLTNVTVDASSVVLSNRSSARADATARGVSVAGGLAIGSSVATARMASTVTTSVTGGSITANTVNLQTGINSELGTNARAEANSSSGGILSGNGSEANAWLDYSVSTTLRVNITAGASLTVLTDAAAARSRAIADGKSFGVAAIGLVRARTGQSTGNTASVTTTVESGLILARGTVRITSSNAPDMAVDLSSGTGGLIQGSGAEAFVTARTLTATRIGTTGATSVLSETGSVILAATQTATVDSVLDNRAGALIGASGANARTTVVSTVASDIGGAVNLTARNFDISAANNVIRPYRAYNIKSASGGAIDIPAMVSRVTVDADTDLRVMDGAEIVQTGNPFDPGFFSLGITTDMALSDRLFLDAGGAVAVPIGDSNVRVNSNDATVTIGDATLLSLGEMSIYNGGNANLRSEVDSTSYGLAGAATSLTRATYNAANVIRLNNGADLESLDDIRLMAGYVRDSVQSVTIRAEARAFNKTAFPINIDPVADATANTFSLVDIGAGSKVTAVRDVYLLSEAGRRDVLGYGRGKDLYREVAAEIANALGDLVGADDVSLDIETGTSTDLSNDGVLVNGKVRAGSRNKQVLILGLDGFGNYRILNDETRQEANPNLYYDNAWAEDITWTVTRNVAPSVDLQNRINELNGYLANPALTNASTDVFTDGVRTGSTDPARQAWISEIATLQQRQAGVAGLLVDWIEVGPILAVEGNIILEADYVQGTTTGELNAPGDALIKVWAESGAWLETNDMTIPTAEGGRITMNGVLVNNTNDVRIQSGSRPGPYAFNMISGQNDGDPKIEVVTFTPDTGARGDGTIILSGNLLNLRGEAFVNSNAGSVDIRSDISAKTIKVNANNDVFIGYTPGVTNIGGSPEGQYRLYFAARQDQLRFNFLYTPQVFSLGAAFNGPVLVPINFAVAPTEGALKAGRNVYISADKLNINGLIQAGTGTFDVTISAGIEAELDALRLQAGRSGRVLIHDTAFPESGRVARSANIAANTNVKVYYNFDTNQIELDDMFVRGGTVMITGDIISTGNGRIEALDGFGRVNINSQATTDLVIRRIDLGGETDATRGLAGLVRITDTSRMIAGRGFLITDFVRNGNVLEVYNNLGPVGNVAYNVKVGEDANGADVFVTMVRPGDLVSTSTADGGRSSTYTPTANRDLIYVTAERTTTTWTNRREVLVIIGISGTTSEEKVNVNVNTRNVTEALGQAPYVGASLPGPDYAYAVRGNFFIEESGPTEAERKTHDSVEWWKLGSGWRHYERNFREVRVTRYEHRLKADYPISIYFNGSDQAQMNVTSAGNVIFSRTVINELGTTNVTSTGGSILTGSSSVILNTSDTVLSAVNGSIRGVDGAFQMNQTANGTLQLTAGDAIDVQEQNGNMNIVAAETLRRPAGTSTAQIGTIRLTAQGSILQIGAGSIVRGTDITLVAQDGSLGTSEAQSFRIDTQGGNLTATARNNIFIEETTGNLGVREVFSTAGDVTLIARNGAILDRNNNETRDIRTLTELQQLWGDEIGLYGTEAINRRTEDLLANIGSERTQLYRDYWTKRGTGPSAEFTLDRALEASLRQPVTLENGTVIPGWSDARIAAYVAERQALFDAWNATETAYDPQRRITVTAADLDPAYLDSIAWSESSLQRSLRSSLVRVTETGDTNIRVEDPNVRAAGNITLLAGTSIGELVEDYIIPSGGSLSNADLEILFTAEKQDIVIDEAQGQIRVRRNENLDFAFESIDVNGNSLGSLRAIAGTQEVFLAALTPATIARVQSPGRVDLRISGNMADNAGTGSQAVQGQIIVLESGNAGAIGTADKPLTVNVLPSGSLTARSGVGVHILAPLSGLPLREIFSGGPVSLVAAGAITDLVGADVPRIILGGDLLLDGASIGTADALLGIQMNDTTGSTARLVTRTGNAYLKSFSDLPLESASLAAGGRVVMETGKFLRLLSQDTVAFGAAATLRLDLPEGIDMALSSGTDFTGGTLEVRTNGAFGTVDKPVVTDLAVLDYAAMDRDAEDRDTSLWLRDIGSLRLANALMNANTGVVTDVRAAADLSVGLADSVGLTRLRAGRDLTDGRIIAERAELIAGRDMGSQSRIDLTVGEFQAETLVDGDASLLLRDRDVDVDYITLNGTGALDLIAQNAAVDVQPGAGITTNTGALLMRVEDLRLQADVTSQEGNVDLGVTGGLSTEAAVTIGTGAGTLRLAVTGDATIGDDNLIRTLNGTDTALRFDVAGQLSAGNQAAPLVQANTDGALATLRFGSVLNTGPTGIRIQVARLDSITEEGAIHLREEDGITVEQIIAENGNVDLFTTGDTVLRRAEARGVDGGALVIGSGGSLLGDTPELVGEVVKLFGFGGRLGGETVGTSMRADTAPGAEVWLLSRDDLDYTETAGNLRLALGASLEADMNVRVAAGSMTAGLLGSRGTMVLEALGTLDVNMIGRTAIDIADEVGLQLVDSVPTRYGFYDIPSPTRLFMRALGEGSLVRLGLGNVRDVVELYADRLDANLYDVTPGDGLRLRLADDSGAGFTVTDVNVIGDGPQLNITDPFADVRPLLAGRFLAKQRPEDPAQSASQGEVVIEFARIETGQVTTAGPSLIGENIVINGDVWFRQRTFDLLATIVYRNLDTSADAQVLAWRFEPGETRPVTGKISFDLSNEIELLTWHVFPLNRRLGGVSLNGGQGFVFGVGSETQIMVNSFLRNIGDPGVVTPLFSRTFGSGVPEGEDPVLKFPLLLASL